MNNNAGAGRAIRIHGVDDARAAAAAARTLGVGVRLVSAPGAASYAGAAWFAEVIAAVRAEYPATAIEAVLDCGDAPGHALAALRAGVETIRFTGPRRVRDKIAALARHYGARLGEIDGEVLDLAQSRHPEEDCRRWLAEDRKPSGAL
jgi:DNA-binding transcriptional LysR family regulator